MPERNRNSPIMTRRLVSEQAPDLLARKDLRSPRHGLGWSLVRHHPLPMVTLLLLVLSLTVWLLGQGTLANWILFAIILIGALPLLWDTLRQLWHKEFGVDVIAILAIGGSLVLKQYLAGALIVLMLSGGEALEAYALRRARASLSALAERAPRIAHRWCGEELVSIPAEEVEVGMEVVVKPGELVPVDGVVLSGTSNLSEADLTGEPMPVRKSAGMPILSGSINLDSVIEVRASKRSTESQYAQIVHLVEEAQTRKAPIHRLVDRYSIVLIAVAMTLAVLAWLLSHDPIWALAVLVVATPCPLILATPIAIMSGIDLAARHGIIVKSGASIEQLGSIDVAVFDKTGTLTLGQPKVTEMVLADPALPVEGKDTLLRLAASVEQLSTHILARAVVEAAQAHAFPLSSAEDVEEIFGKGVSGRVPVLTEDRRGTWLSASDWVEVAVGNRTFLRHLGIVIPESLL
ncbi:MAG TPA: HAD-IC family P-type ATPase, partial [Ktedonobacteraceae bacterium]|nr:HAD-IC family P-type ATPase [Ktedonobacteraceae bacterium]